MAEQRERPPVPSSPSFSFDAGRPVLPTVDWLRSSSRWVVQRGEEAGSTFVVPGLHEDIAEQDPSRDVGIGGGTTAGKGWLDCTGRLKEEEFRLQDWNNGSSTHSIGIPPAARRTACRMRPAPQPCDIRSELTKSFDRKNVPVATSEKWQDRVASLTGTAVCDPERSAALLGGVDDSSSPLLFRRNTGNGERNDNSEYSERGLMPSPVTQIQQIRTLPFDLNCLPDTDINDNVTITDGGCSGLDLMQFVDASAEDTFSSYSLSDTEDQDVSEENLHPHANVAQSVAPAVGPVTAPLVQDMNISAASSTGSTNCPEKGEEVNGPRTKRHYRAEGPNVREKQPGKKSALEMALTKFADRTTPYIIDPAIGTEFDCVAEAFDYYNLYSWEVGFGIKYGRTRYSENKNIKDLEPSEKYVLSVDMKCCCAGVPDKKHRVSGKLGCGAMIRLHRTHDHGYVVVEHKAEHNHPLSETCGEKRQWPSHKRIDKHTKDLIRMLRENNIGLTKLYTILGSFFGSMENVPTTKRNLRAVCQKIAREEADEDIKKTLLVFREMREADPGFLYSVDPDKDGRIKSLMWTNSRSRMQYAHFGDVVTFDTTYRTNLYDMPFGMFVGVNNHFQSVIFGGVLLTEETIESFQWVFKEFVSMMGGKKPQTILTDQCRAMEVAISMEWEGVAHKWCKWHVLKRVAECLGTKYTSNKAFRDKFHKLLNEMLTKQEFKKAWKELLAEHGLSKNTFLDQIYKTRKKWVKSYFPGVFCAKQTSTQRSECANSMVKNLVPPGCTIHHFVRQYAKLLHTMDDSENYEERRTKLFTRDLSMGGPLIAHAAKVYTYKVFGMFCKIKTYSEDYFATEVVKGREYIAEHYNLEKVQRWCKGRYVVKVENGCKKFICECGLFEHFGLPCCHSLRVMITVGLKSIPDAMIMRRWTRKARLILPADLAKYSEPNPAVMAQTYRHAALYLAALELVKLGDSNVRCFHILMACFAAAKEKLSEASKTKDGLGLEERESAKDNLSGQNTVDHLDDDVSMAEDLFPLRAPKRKRERGRPTNARDRPAYENLSKRPKFCKTCRAPDHRSDTCPHRDKSKDKPRAPPTCRGCGLQGHTVANCGSDKQIAAMAAAF